MGKAGSICQRLTLPAPAPLLQRTLLPREGWRTSSLVQFSKLWEICAGTWDNAGLLGATCRSSNLRVGRAGDWALLESWAVPGHCCGKEGRGQVNKCTYCGFRYFLSVCLLTFIVHKASRGKCAAFCCSRTVHTSVLVASQPSWCPWRQRLP